MSSAPAKPPRIHAALLLIFGASFCWGGAQLIMLGGSLYYAVAGVTLITSAILLWRGNAAGAWLYGLCFVGTCAWGLLEVGPDGWALLPRIAVPAVLGLWLLLPWTRRRLAWRMGSISPPRPIFAAGLAALVLIFSALVMPAADHVSVAPAAGPDIAPVSAAIDTDWPSYASDSDAQRHVQAALITPANVNGLKPAWQFRTGDMPAGNFSFEATPIKVGGLLYTCTPSRQVIALDAESGRQVWRFVPKAQGQIGQLGKVCRGVVYHAQANTTGSCGQRILATNTDGSLWALDALTGKPCPDFGTAGAISLRDGLGRVNAGETYNTSPGTVVGNSLILGSYVVDGKSIDEPSGVVRAYDVITGKLRWAWDMGIPDRIGAPPPGQSYTRSTPNAWTMFTADSALGLVYVPTGNPSPDFFGGMRRSFDEKYGTALVALDVRTGRPRWSFQMVHHDLWDMDGAAQPMLVDLRGRNGTIPAVIQLSKTGDIFVLDRRTGKPIFPVAERSVPLTGGVPEDRLSPAQPASAISFRPRALRETDMWGATPFDQMLCRIRFREARHEGPFTPPGITPAIGYPTAAGVFSWGGGSIDTARRTLIVNASYMPFLTRLVPKVVAGAAGSGDSGNPAAISEYGLLEQAGTPYRYTTSPFLGILGTPCIKPPWGELIALDIDSGKVLWRRRLGTGRDSGPLGIPSFLPFRMGVPNTGGPVTTTGGLVFIGATLDRYLRAFDIRTGDEVWRARLPAGPQATPMTFVAGNGKRQYVVIAAGGHPGMASRPGDYLVAYRLSADD